MFACLIPGRLVETNIKQLDERRFAFELENAESINHIVVFMTGTSPFPPGLAATLHALFPGPTAEWQLLGMLSNEKPSAIFRLRGTVVPSQSTFIAAAGTGAGSFPAAGTTNTTAMLGIMVEEEAAVQQHIAMLPPPKGSSSNPTSSTSTELVPASSPGLSPQNAIVLAEMIAKNLFHYISSFADMSPQPSFQEVVQRWYQGFESKLRNAGISFLASQDFRLRTSLKGLV